MCAHSVRKSMCIVCKSRPKNIKYENIDDENGRVPLDLYVCIYIYIYVYICICIYMYTYVYIYRSAHF